MVIDNNGTAVHARTIVVGVVSDRCTGSLSYALQGALTESARVRIVRVSGAGTLGRPNLQLPVDTIDVEGDPIDVLTEESRHADLMVIESPVDLRAALIDPLMVHLRDTTECLLVEVDRDGQVVRASGPQGWRCSIVPHEAYSMPSSGTPGAPAVVTVGVDNSEASASAVRWARAHAAETGATLRLVGVYASTDEARRVDAEKAVASAAATLGDTSLETLVSAGEPAGALLEAARGSSLLVIGRHSHRGMIHSALSIGDTCARLAECPVVIVPQN
ncbi:universal stress protein [Aeromicrobium sp.]|uniref:universal stress protein n=1 Tax=Aeromicrobium sp. TaxID=1871063 RepID=UPI0019B174CF|nr:universal stress protein [Aeromicrobium sp.]MBC7633595.1 universal stress protein [Aeromicrobium sp.]